MYRPSTVKAGYGLEDSLIHDYMTAIVLLHMGDKDYLMKLTTCTIKPGGSDRACSVIEIHTTTLRME